MKAVLFFVVLLYTSCSKRIFEAMEPGKLYDEYFFMRKNGHYSFKQVWMDMIRLPDNQRGRYILSNDTVYFVRKEAKNAFTLKGFGIIDSAAGKFYYRYNDTLEWHSLQIRQMPTRKRYKEWEQ
ncbi:MAG: hypothetical protein HOP10_12445 [Chitinophagaceae bacterium]|nr:hypothetical protein [Chitinophagaceae bacterium]